MAIRLSKISGMEWWNGTLEWNTGMGNLNQKSFTDAVQHNNYYYKVNTLRTHMSHFDSCVAVYIIVIIVAW